jgi:Winged helix DNA-binding domain
VTTVLTARALNRALLQRHGLLERTRAPVLETIERLVGMQAQVPSNPYVALWSRLEDCDPEELSTLIAERRAVRAQLMRGTIHLVSARDALAMHPPSLPVLAGIFRSNFARRLAGAPVDEVVRAGTELLAEQPRTRAELAPLLAGRWPDAEPATLAQAVAHHAPLVQVPPRGLWGRSGQPRLALTEQWLDDRLDGDGAEEALVMRYLAAFGPATVSDVRTWSRFTGLRAVVDRLRPRLRTFADERGRELLDVPDGPLPDPATPAPPRFLPEYDNVLLSHDDRSRTLAGLGPGKPWPHGRWIGMLLADGFFRAYWKAEDGTLTVDRFTPHADDLPGLRDDIVAEGERLLAFIDPEAARRRVIFAP